MSEHDNEIAGHQVLRQIGFDAAGGFGLGCLYEAVDRTGRHVALKVARVNVLPQVVIKANNQHPNLVELLGYWVVDERGQMIETAPRDASRYTDQPVSLVFATPLKTEPFLERAEEIGPGAMTTPELLRYLACLADGIDFLTAPKLIEGVGNVALHAFEVSPEDLWGIPTRAVFDDIGAGVYDQVGDGINIIVGNPRYMAPERLQGISCRSSVLYSFAVAYHVLRTGTLPFAEVPGRMSDLIAACVENRLDLSRLPRAERRVVQKALATDPDQRHERCTELVQDLQRAIRRRCWQFLG